MKAAELRQSILQAAVQGKLVPQDIHDEPASVLLERIRAEKARLVKEGKIKKEKPLLPIVEDEIPYDLPEGWIWCRLRELIQIAENNNIHKNLPENTLVNYVDIDAIDNKKYCIKDVKQIPVKSLSSRARRVLQKGFIVYSLVRPYLNNIAVVEDEKENYIGSTGFVVFKPIKIEINYFISFLLSPFVKTYYLSLLSGFNSPSVSQEDFLSTPFPLPPLAEQQRIVSKVNELMSLCDELEAVEQELDALESHFEEYLPKSILQAAVQGKLLPQDIHDEPAPVLLERIRTEKVRLIKEGKIKKEKPIPPITEDNIPYDLPEGWVWCRLGELCNFGETISAMPDNIPDDAWVLELEDIQKDTGEIVQYKTKAERESKSSKHVFYKGDVLYSKLRPYLNKVTIAGKDGYCSSEILPLQFCKDIYPQYAICFLRSPTFVDYAIERSYGVKMPRLGTEDGRNALFPLPPLAEQQRIVAKVNELMVLCEEIKAVKTKPNEQRDTNKVIDFPAVKQDGQIQLAARGEIGKKSSNELMQAIDEMFAGDE
ncbi:MAG TPA: restriction endonuclease subunit S [Mariniphaga sp.]|nr:restriction endonuclease subunit S [Mariniphaga sp.]